MSTQDSKKSLKERLRKFGGNRTAVSPVPAPTQSTGTFDHRTPRASISAAQSSKAEDSEYSSRAVSSSTTDAQSPPSNLLLADVRATLPSTDRGASDAQEPATPSPPGTTPNRADEHESKEPSSAISQRLWNAAYDSLENEEKELVGSYLKTLDTILRLEASKDPSSDPGDIAAKLKDPSQRQIYMQKLVKEGREKVAKTSKITKGVGDFVDTVLKVKPIVDFAIQSTPQAAPAALPWAGVCIGLQVS